MKKILLSIALVLALAPASFAWGHHHRGGDSSGGYSAGPNDEDQSADYDRHIGRLSASRLSTGWTHGHGSRTEHVGDYWRHTRSGRLIHVHGYYRH